MSDSAATPSSSGNSMSLEESKIVSDQGDGKSSTASSPPEENKNSTASTPSAKPSTPSAPPPESSDKSPTPPAAPSDSSTTPAAPSNNNATPPAPPKLTPPASQSPPSSGDGGGGGGGGGGSTPSVTPAPEQTITSPPALPPPQNVTSPPSQTNSPGTPSAPATGSPPSTPTNHPTVPSQSPGTPAPPRSNRTRSSATNGSSNNSQHNAISGNNLTEKDKAIIGVATAGSLLIAFAILFFFIKRSKRRNPSAPSVPGAQADDHYFYAQKENAAPKDGFHGAMQNESQRGGSMHHGSLVKLMSSLGGSTSAFSYEEVMEMTYGFSHENVIGEGGFGRVFKGFLHDGKPVAVKQLRANSGQGEREFMAEVEIISRVHHRYLVSLVGYCISQEERLLIYQFVPNNNLEQHLHGDGIPVLEWSKRLKIAIGAAKGLAYLHDDCHPKIIHRDIKSANILLDNNFEALVADFGLARLSSDAFTHVSTRVMGTFGYMAPEYASSGKLTDKSDVFSFGVVLLELVTGRKPVDPEQPSGDESLVEWARPLLIRAVESGDFSELVDSRLGKNYVDSEMSRMVEAAAACVRHSAPKRPRMIQVVRALDSNEELADLSNGVKYGQSTRYDSTQYNQDMERFRRVAFDSSEDMYSGEYGSRSESSSASVTSSGGIRS